LLCSVPDFNWTDRRAFVFTPSKISCSNATIEAKLGPSQGDNPVFSSPGDPLLFLHTNPKHKTGIRRIRDGTRLWATRQWLFTDADTYDEHLFVPISYPDIARYITNPGTVARPAAHLFGLILRNSIRIDDITEALTLLKSYAVIQNAAQDGVEIQRFNDIAVNKGPKGLRCLVRVGQKLENAFGTTGQIMQITPRDHLKTAEVCDMVRSCNLSSRASDEDSKRSDLYRKKILVGTSEPPTPGKHFFANSNKPR
jgi:hypothetical protein